MNGCIAHAVSWVVRTTMCMFIAKKKCARLGCGPTGVAGNEWLQCTTHTHTRTFINTSGHTYLTHTIHTLTAHVTHYMIIMVACDSSLEGLDVFPLLARICVKCNVMCGQGAQFSEYVRTRCFERERKRIVTAVNYYYLPIFRSEEKSML